MTRSPFATLPLVAPPRSDILSTFRRRFIDELTGLFLQVLRMAKEMKLRKMGTVCPDGAKIHVNVNVNANADA